MLVNVNEETEAKIFYLLLKPGRVLKLKFHETAHFFYYWQHYLSVWDI